MKEAVRFAAGQPETETPEWIRQLRPLSTLSDDETLGTLLQNPFKPTEKLEKALSGYNLTEAQVTQILDALITVLLPRVNNFYLDQIEKREGKYVNLGELRTAGPQIFQKFDGIHRDHRFEIASQLLAVGE